MTQLLTIHPETPQKRLIAQVVEALHKGGVIVYPTDSAYALGCQIGDKAAQERIRRLRQLDEGHHFTLMCRDFSELSAYARVDNPTFRLLKAHTPGPYTFLLPATHEVPRRLQHSKRKSIGLRIPKNPIALELLEALGEPLLSVSMILPGQKMPLNDPQEIYTALKGQIDVIIDGGFCGLEPTTVVDLTGDSPRVLRKGAGDPARFE